jgi:hypothetical protein
MFKISLYFENAGFKKVYTGFCLYADAHPYPPQYFRVEVRNMIL